MKIMYRLLLVVLSIFALSIPSRVLAKTYNWNDFSVPFKKEIRISSAAEIKIELPAEIIERYERLPLIVSYRRPHTDFYLSLRVNHQPRRSKSVIAKTRDRYATTGSETVLIDSKYLKAGQNTFRFSYEGSPGSGFWYVDITALELDFEKFEDETPAAWSGKSDGIYQWEDYSKPFKREIRFGPKPKIVEVDFPRDVLINFKEATLIIEHSGVGEASGAGPVARSLQFTINGNTIAGGDDIGSNKRFSSAPIKLKIDAKYFKSGSNRLWFKAENRFTGGSWRLYGLSFKLSNDGNATTIAENSEREKASNQNAAIGSESGAPQSISSAAFPKMVVGDAWTLDTAFGLEHHKVTKVRPDGGFVIEKKEEKSGIVFQLHFDNKYRLVKKLDLEANQRHKVDDPPALYLDFPLYVGKKWEDKYYGRTLNRTVIPQELECSYLVDKIETIETRAGSVNTFKINRWFNSPSYAFVQRESYWYSPELKVIIKTDPIYDRGAELYSYSKAPRTDQLAVQESENKQLTNAETKTSISVVKEKQPEVKKPKAKVVREAKPEPVVQPIVAGVRWAVVIGVSNYQDSRIPSLRYANKDARSFYDWLISPKGGRYALSRVKLLVDKNATGIGIRNSLFEWLGQALEEDVVTIFFAGHGSPQSPDNPENLFLLPFDTNYDSVATTGFPMWDIETALKRFIRAKKVIVIADACHAGGVGQAFDVARRAGRGMHTVTISSNLQNLSRIGDGICIISASDDSQFSQESKKWGGGHGVFTYYLLRGLKGEADYSKDQKVTLGEIVPYLSEQVRRATRNAQSPTVAGRFDPALTIGK